MIKTTEKKRPSATTLTLIVCLGALPLLSGLAGCSSARPGAQTENEPHASMAGPAGPDDSGPAGIPGASGGTGEQGARSAGFGGSVDQAGPAGEKGAPAPVGVTSGWTSYRDLRFNSDQAKLRASEKGPVSEIAAYLQANPSLNVGVNCAMQPPNQELSNQRFTTVHDALVKAGIPASRIKAGAFADGELPPNGHVTVLIRSAN
jgi:outer membrane protein OmpA-like peptidoglycan-associated protein